MSGIIKCKMCGGDLNLVEGVSTAECEFCGSVQTIPNLDDEKKLIQFERAERLRKQCEFDKAAGIYESIVADFRQEAEAYWGLVLCKYGIEYVDDPGTGKKIPTCHRSSFDSILDDPDFEQALENADTMACRVYRDEAKRIEEIRKGILEVSSNEQPYDIFICYKETDSQGDRTVDSVLAQDIYDALTSKNYRVFFSRITLEDKLGQAYEPYIFAALNSAKIMLAVGTSYEYYNAVWVKNEWSRYLKIVAQDKSKYLIPCYKGIDAYDIPKEFAHLQGQDMGKVGALQDLLRGIEKILPREKPQVMIQERVIVGGESKISAMLDRGNMALEDGDWEKADGFFEDVLNNDSKNARAYLGKALVQEKSRTLEAFVKKRKNMVRSVTPTVLSISENEFHIQEMIEQYMLPGYLEPDTIRRLFKTSLSYSTEVPAYTEWHREENAYWTNHKTLSRAEQFADEELAQKLKDAKKQVIMDIQQRIKQAEADELNRKMQRQEEYNAHLADVDERLGNLYGEKIKLRASDYDRWLEVAKTSRNKYQLDEARFFFEKLNGFRDSEALAQHCTNRVEEITAAQKKVEEEALELEAMRRKETEERVSKNLAHNKKLRIRLKWIERILFLLAFCALTVSMESDMDIGAMILTGFLVQYFMCLVPVGSALLYLRCLDKKKKLEKFFGFISRVTNLIAIVVYLVATVNNITVYEPDVHGISWACANVAMSLCAFVLPLFAKKTK